MSSLTVFDETQDLSVLFGRMGAECPAVLPYFFAPFRDYVGSPSTHVLVTAISHYLLKKANLVEVLPLLFAYYETRRTNLTCYSGTESLSIAEAKADLVSKETNGCISSIDIFRFMSNDMDDDIPEDITHRFMHEFYAECQGIHRFGCEGKFTLLSLLHRKSKIQSVVNVCMQLARTFGRKGWVYALDSIHESLLHREFDYVANVYYHLNGFMNIISYEDQSCSIFNRTCPFLTLSGFRSYLTSEKSDVGVVFCTNDLLNPGVRQFLLSMLVSSMPLGKTNSFMKGELNETAYFSKVSNSLHFVLRPTVQQFESVLEFIGGCNFEDLYDAMVVIPVLTNIITVGILGVYFCDVALSFSVALRLITTIRVHVLMNESRRFCGNDHPFGSSAVDVGMYSDPTGKQLYLGGQCGKLDSFALSYKYIESQYEFIEKIFLCPDYLKSIGNRAVLYPMVCENASLKRFWLFIPVGFDGNNTYTVVSGADTFQITNDGDVQYFFSSGGIVVCDGQPDNLSGAYINQIEINLCVEKLRLYISCGLKSYSLDLFFGFNTPQHFVCQPVPMKIPKSLVEYSCKLFGPTSELLDYSDIPLIYSSFKILFNIVTDLTSVDDNDMGGDERFIVAYLQDLMVRQKGYALIVQRFQHAVSAFHAYYQTPYYVRNLIDRSLEESSEDDDNGPEGDNELLTQRVLEDLP